MFPTLAGKYTPRDSRFVTRALDRDSHCGYQTWHRELDAEVVEWLETHPNATQFEQFFRARYAQPDLPACGAFIGMRAWLNPRRAEVMVHGATAGDVAFESNTAFLVSERFREAFESVGLLGVSSFDEVDVLPGSASLGRWYFPVIEREFAVDRQRSRVSGDPSGCDECGVAGVDGVEGFGVLALGEPADIGWVSGLPGFIVVSERMVGVIADHGLTNTLALPTETFIWPSGRNPD